MTFDSSLVNGFTGHLLLMSSLCAIKLSLFKDFNIKLHYLDISLVYLFLLLKICLFSEKNEYLFGSSTSTIKKILLFLFNHL